MLVAVKRCLGAVTRHVPVRGRYRLGEWVEAHTPDWETIVPVAMEGLPAFRLVVHPRRSPVDCFLHYCGTYEPHELRLFASLLRPGDTVLDVGANLGLYSVLAGLIVGAGGQVHAFEPFPAMVAKLQRNLALNGLTNVTVVPKALAARAGEGSLYLAGEPGSNSLTPGPGFAGALAVPLIDLDGYLEAAGVTQPVRAMKMDIEGAELMALRGADRLLSQHRPALLLEVNPPRLAAGGGSSRELVELLQFYGYTVEAVTADGLQPVGLERYAEPSLWTALARGKQ